MTNRVRIRDKATSRSDLLVAEVVNNDSTVAELRQATATQAGIVELATTAEASAGIDTQRAVTPAGLASAVPGTVPAASTTVAGKVELATNIETLAVTSQSLAVTPYGLGAAFAGFHLMSFTGMDGSVTPGACTATGLVVADVVRSVVGLTTMGDKTAKFETAITVVNQIQQVAQEDLDAENFLVLVYRAT